MYCKCALKEKIHRVKGLVKLLQALAKMERWCAVNAVLQAIHEIFAINPIFAFNNAKTAWLQNLKNGKFHDLLEKIPERALQELQYIRNYELPKKLQSILWPNIGVGLQIFLNENEDEGTQDEDNFLVNMEIPLEFFAKNSSTFTSIMEEHGNFAEYVLAHAYPLAKNINISDLYSVWVDLNISFYIGVKLNHNKSYGFITQQELRDLLQWQDIARDNITDITIYHPLNNEISRFDIFNKLQFSLHELERGIAYELPTDMQILTFSRFQEAFEAVSDRLLGFNNLDNESVLLKTAKFCGSNPLSYNQTDSLGNAVLNIWRLDQAIKILEPLARTVIAEAQRVISWKLSNVNTFSADNNSPGLSHMTLWTRDNGQLSPYFLALPLISAQYASKDLLCSGNDWSEVPHIIENMEYLTHIIAHDSALSWSDIGRTDYITLRIDFTRQFYSCLHE